jgi:hypothetical protein
MKAEPTPRLLEVFETVCRTGSTKAAALELGMTPTGVRDALHRLYVRIGADGIGHAAWLIWGSQSEHPYKRTG